MTGKASSATRTASFTWAGTDNRLSIILIRGEAPVMDAKYDLERHPNLKYTGDGGAAPYVHNAPCLYDVGDLDFEFTSLDEIEIIDELEESDHEK